MIFDDDFDISRPIDHTLIADLPGWHRNTKVQVKALLAKEHIEPDVGGYGGQHVKGSARAFLQSTEPTTRPDGDAITTAASTAAVKDDGRLAVLTGIKTGYNVLRVYAATSAGVSTGWSNLHVASVDKAFSVELTGDDNIEIENNKAILWRKHNEPATTISAIKVNTSNEVEILHALTVAGAVQVGGKITNVTDPSDDQDAATKAYVASEKTDLLGAGVSKDAATTYTAEASGVLVVRAMIRWIYYTETYVSVLSDDNATPTTVVGRIGGMCTRGDSAQNIQYLTCSVPIVKGKKYRVTTTEGGAVVESITWYPNE